MIPSLSAIQRRLDIEFSGAFEPARQNRLEAGIKVAELAHHLTMAASLLADAHHEDAYARFEMAEIAAARSLQLLVGARITQAFRGRAHLAHKHFIIAALAEFGKATPPLERLVQVTRVRNLLEYDAWIGADQLTPRAFDEARQSSDQIRAAILEICAELGVAVPVRRDR